jgi:hypothetical protein
MNFCKDVWIKKEFITPYNLQKNGVAKRKNKTIIEAVKTMIHDQDIPMCLWVEATMTTVYVQNQLSHIALGFNTTGRDVHRKEARGKPSKNIWLPSIYTYTKRQKKQVGTLKREGNICGIL